MCFILYQFGNKTFWPCLKILNGPNCIWFYAKLLAFRCIYSVRDEGDSGTSPFSLDTIWSFLNSMFIRAGMCQPPGSGNCFSFPLPQLWWNQTGFCTLFSRTSFLYSATPPPHPPKKKPAKNMQTVIRCSQSTSDDGLRVPLKRSVTGNLCCSLSSLLISPACSLGTDLVPLNTEFNTDV